MNLASGIRNKAEIVMEAAMRQRFKERKTVRSHPTIAELEELLKADNEPGISIMPDGSVEVIESVFITDLVKSAIAALYENGFVIAVHGAEQEEEEDGATSAGKG